VPRGSGIETEAELPFTGSHLILRPVMDRLGANFPGVIKPLAIRAEFLQHPRPCREQYCRLIGPRPKTCQFHGWHGPASFLL
jgi:hypothetical protein